MTKSERVAWAGPFIAWLVVALLFSLWVIDKRFARLEALHPELQDEVDDRDSD